MFPKVKEILTWFNIPYPPDTKKPTLCPNPNHNDTKPSFHISKDGNTCYCFGAGCLVKNGYTLLLALAGSKDNAKKILNMHGYTRNDEKIEKTRLIPDIETQYIDCIKNMQEDEEKLQFFLDRGFTLETIKKFKIGFGVPYFHYESMRRRYIIPVLSPLNKILNLVGRATNDHDEPKYLKLSKENSSLSMSLLLLDVLYCFTTITTERYADGD